MQYFTGINVFDVFCGKEKIFFLKKEKIKRKLPTQPSLAYVTRACHFFVCVSTDCSGQDEQFSLVFTIASAVNSFVGLPTGFLFDHFGTLVTRLCAM